MYSYYEAFEDHLILIKDAVINTCVNIISILIGTYTFLQNEEQFTPYTHTGYILKTRQSL